MTVEHRGGRLAVVIAVLLAAFAIAGAFFAAGYALWSNASRTDDTARLAQQIQDERAANILRACREVNQRHDATIHQLNVLVNAIPDKDRRARARQNIAGTVALINALAPKHNCEALVDRQVDTSK